MRVTSPKRSIVYAFTSWVRAGPVRFKVVRWIYLRLRQTAQKALYPIRRLLPARLQIFAVRGRAQSFMALVAPDGAYLYVTVHKAGNSTIKRRLWKLQGADIPEEGALVTIHSGAGPFLGLHDFAGRELVRLMRGPGPFRFTFVRNPYSRLISAYRDKMLDLNGHYAGRRFEHTLPLPKDRPPTFAEFVRAAAAQPDEGCDWHWISQHRASMCDVIDYDFIGRLESFEPDFDRVLAGIGAARGVLEGVENLNQYQPAEDEDGAGDCRYDQALADIAWRRYRRDFELFGYDRDSWREWS